MYMPMQQQCCQMIAPRSLHLVGRPFNTAVHGQLDRSRGLPRPIPVSYLSHTCLIPVSYLSHT
eukprot:352348-Chlamydomonas_euryale.AAC.2